MMCISGSGLGCLAALHTVKAGRVASKVYRAFTGAGIADDEKHSHVV